MKTELISYWLMNEKFDPKRPLA